MARAARKGTTPKAKATGSERSPKIGDKESTAARSAAKADALHGGRDFTAVGAPGAAPPASPEKVGLPTGVGSSHPGTEIVALNDPNEIAQPPYKTYQEGIAAARLARNNPPKSRDDLREMNVRRGMDALAAEGKLKGKDLDEWKTRSRTAQPTRPGQVTTA